jgi:uncharacterized protein
MTMACTSWPYAVKVKPSSNYLGYRLTTMQFNLEIDHSRYAIRSYGPGEVTVTIPRNSEDPAPGALDAIGPDSSRVRQEVLTRSTIITPTRLVRDWPPQSFGDLAPSHMDIILELAPEIVLLGSGNSLLWPDAAIVAPLAAAGIGYEIMNTAAACRTYNILMGDGRRVAAALLMI